jgi:hypothetical protein
MPSCVCSGMPTMPLSALSTTAGPGMTPVSGTRCTLPFWIDHFVSVRGELRMWSRAMPKSTLPRGSGLPGSSGAKPG